MSEPRLTVVVLEDDPGVRSAVVRDLEPFAATVRIEEADTVDDAWAIVDEVMADEDLPALLLVDHGLPGRKGVDLLVEAWVDPRTSDSRKILLTAEADQAATIRAVNEGGLDHYIAKPWDPDVLRATVRKQLTDFVLTTGTAPDRHVDALDAERVAHLLGREEQAAE
ncbi:response regulator [Georgenia sp. Z1491]|uniref:response regulator n=1 Tax=Georgenia sp. Z1491 TaxID=3416707 RepID=UPI003CF5D6A7